MSNITKRILKLESLDKSVFNIADLRLSWNIEDKHKLRVIISRALEKGYLKDIRRGIYALPNKEINKFELAGKIKKNSYISFETVLAQEGIIFQWYNEIFSVSERTIVIKNKFGNFTYRHLPQKILDNKMGIKNKGNYFIATAERAFCDKVYKDGFGYFDDTTSLDKNKLLKISKLYNNKRLEKEIKNL